MEPIKVKVELFLDQHYKISVSKVVNTKERKLILKLIEAFGHAEVASGNKQTFDSLFQASVLTHHYQFHSVLIHSYLVPGPQLRSLRRSVPKRRTYEREQGGRDTINGSLPWIQPYRS